MSSITSSCSTSGFVPDAAFSLPDASFMSLAVIVVEKSLCLVMPSNSSLSILPIHRRPVVRQAVKEGVEACCFLTDDQELATCRSFRVEADVLAKTRERIPRTLYRQVR